MCICLCRVRAKLAELDPVEAPGAGQRLLLSLLDIDPAMRPTMHEALRSPVFHALRHEPTGTSPSLGTNRGTRKQELRYMHYYRGGAGAEVAAPPML